MAATAELLQKLQRQRLRMGESGDGIQPETRAQGAEAEEGPGTNALDRSGSSFEDEVQGELQLKLKRQRRRMGEFGVPLQEISNQELEEPPTAAKAVGIGVDGTVRQRALKFEGVEQASPSQPQLPGRVNLKRWEAMLQEAPKYAVEEQAEKMRRHRQYLQQEELSEVTRELQLPEACQEQNQECGEDQERQQQTIELQQGRQQEPEQQQQQQQQQEPEEYGEQPQHEDDQDHQEEQEEQHCPFGVAHDFDQYPQFEAYQMLRQHELEVVFEIPEEELSQIQTEELNETIQESQLSQIHIETPSELDQTVNHESDDVQTDTEQLWRDERLQVSVPSNDQSAEGNDREQLGGTLHQQPVFSSNSDAPGFKWSSIGPVAYESDDEQELDQLQTNCKHALPANVNAVKDEHARAPEVSLAARENRHAHSLPPIPTICEDKHADEVRVPAQAAQWYSLADGDDDIPEDDWEDPLEFAMLDYCGSLPQGVVASRFFKAAWLRKLEKRNKVLGTRVREIGKADDTAPDPVATAPASPKARPSTPLKQRNRCPTSPQSRPRSPCSPALSSASPLQLQRTVANASVAAAEARRQRLLRAEMSLKVEAISTERARQRDAQTEANLKARLDGTMKASKEQILAMHRRAEQEEERIRNRFEMAMRTKDGLERSLKAVLREVEQTKEQTADLENWFASLGQMNKAEDEGRLLVRRQVKQLASELKAHRARAQRCQQRQRRTNDMVKELEGLKIGLQKYIE